MKTHKGEYIPKHPEKYIGTKKITYRSSWEYSFCVFCDNQPSVLAWSSESISIPYRNPLTGRNTIYVPDFLVIYDNKKGKRIVEMVEIKPAKEVPGLMENQRISKHTKLTQVVNAAKWQAAAAFCAKRGIRFRVVTELDLFQFKRKK